MVGKFRRIAEKLRKIKGGRQHRKVQNGNYLSQNYIPPRNLTTAKCYNAIFGGEVSFPPNFQKKENAMTKEKIEIDSNIVRFGKGGYISLDDFPNRFSATINAFDKEKCIINHSNYRTFSVEEEGRGWQKTNLPMKRLLFLLIMSSAGVEKPGTKCAE